MDMDLMLMKLEGLLMKIDIIIRMQRIIFTLLKMKLKVLSIDPKTKKRSTRKIDSKSKEFKGFFFINNMDTKK